ncbi:hypothetical protein K458DRAFT_392278 [Lentithecium fluviatile CBS 122367]|uniref:Acid protease n=1 Tax=Lentithecium fluviatile CBS 122367 TaxID=1168545 RepID=A0A6G1ISH2_9PLEO|nr:hypothetical protein K458DRAFT_392278 [Lentithecium fluviatile CBS 122367]
MLPRELRIYIALFSLITSPTSAAKCAAPPLNLPYRNISVTPGLLTKGIPMQLGTPWQQVALIPSLQLDNTFIPRFSNTCVHNEVMPMDKNITNGKRDVILDLWERDGHPGSFEENGGDQAQGSPYGAWEGENWWVKCSETYGGGYVPALSPTFHDNGTNDQIREWWFKKVDYKDWHFVTETWRFADYLDVYTHENYVAPEDDKKQTTSSFMFADEGKLFGDVGASLLGLTPQSSLLQALFDRKIVPSMSWSLSNESLCLGCVDAGASKGDFQIFKPADRGKDDKLPCLIQSKVEALNWHPSLDVEGATIIEKSFMACIDPGVKFLVLPNDARATFKKIVERDVKGEYEDYILFKGPPKEDVGLLTVRLEGGLEVNITIPGAGKVGAEETGEWQAPIGKGGWGAYGNQTFVLGKPFTDTIVLRWDAEQQEYGIAPLNPSRPSEPDLKPLGCTEFPKPSHSDNSKQTNTGVLIGSVLGAFTGGLLFALALLFFFRRGRKTTLSKYEPLGDTVPMRAIPSDRRTVDSWMSGALSPPPPSVGGTIGSPSYLDAAGSRSGSRMGERDGMSIIGVSMSGGGGGLGIGAREVNREPVMVADSAVYEGAGREVYEAPEGGTAFPSKRERAEVWSPDLRREDGSV